MPQAPANILLFLLILMLSFGAIGCQAATSPPPTITNTWTPIPTSTVTYTPTITLTPTLANTITPFPSKTPTITPTPFRTLSPTPTPSEVPPQPAVLFPLQDINGRTVDWSYTHVTQIGVDQFDKVNDLWAFMSFQLLDRGIHQRLFYFLGEPITVYYLNVAHAFDGEMLPMQLVLGGTPGENVPIHIIPAGGTAYIQVQLRDFEQVFDPYIIHRDANRDYELIATDYPDMFLKDLANLLPTLSEEVILLADHPILFPRNDWVQIKLDMSRVSYLAARYQPFFEIDDYDRLVDQSDFAYALRDYILDQESIPLGYYAYSSQTLIIIQGEE